MLRSITFLYALLFAGYMPSSYGIEVAAANPNVDYSKKEIVSTYFGGNGDDGFLGIQLALDDQGFIYAAGYSASTDLPIPAGALQPDKNSDYDFFIAKFSQDLSTLIAATYLGGSGKEQYPSVVINYLDQVVIAGYSGSTDFPTGPNAYEPDYSEGGADLVISILDNNLTTLIHSTYLGGSNEEGPYNRPSILALSNGDIFIAGTTASNDFPTSPSGYDRDYSGGKDFIVIRMNLELSELLASTYIGGAGDEEFPSLALDGGGNIFLGGATNSTEYPTTVGAYSRDLSAGFWTGTITKLNNDLSDLLASTMTGNAAALDLACDSAGNLYITGHTDDVNYPTSVTAYDRTHNGTNEGFIAKFDNNLENLVACTYLSGVSGGTCVGQALALDGTGKISCNSLTSSPNMFTTPDALDGTHNGSGDIYFLILTDDLSSLLYSSYLGGSNEDAGSSTVYDKNGNLYLGGMTASSNFWICSECYDTSYNGGSYDGFIMGMIGLTPDCGDANADDAVNIGDGVYLINHIFHNGPAPVHNAAGDVNCDLNINVGDAVYLINYIFRPGSPSPCATCP